MSKGQRPFYKQNTLPALTPQEELPPLPESIGPYKIETLLAKGGMSLLYLGIDLKSREPVAIKVLPPNYTNHPEMVDHFLWEARIIAMANHPNIVKIYDHGKWEGGLYIAMEFIQGVSLCQFLMQQSLSLKRCINLVLQVAYALCHLHAHGVIHRDLKPENILINEEGEVKVIDFGIAQLHEEEPREQKQLLGTPSYMSPEQKSDPSSASFGSDIYALAIIAYELILGKLSYGMIDLPLLPAGLQTILGKALAISVSERYTDIVPFITDLSSYYKSATIDRERPGADLAVELTEQLQRAERSLSPTEKPHWPRFQIGVAQTREANESGIYFDFFRFSNQTIAIIIAHTRSTTIASPIHIGVLRGMVKSLMIPYLHTDAPFDPTDFVTTLNLLICQDTIQETFHLHILKIIPYNDTLSFVCAGSEGVLLHTDLGGNSTRAIHSTNPPIGQDVNASFSASSDTFYDGELLILHNLPQKEFEEPLKKALTEHVLLSSTRLCDALLKEAAKESLFKELRHPKAMIAIQRIS